MAMITFFTVDNDIIIALIFVDVLRDSCAYTVTVALLRSSSTSSDGLKLCGSATAGIGGSYRGSKSSSGSILHTGSIGASRHQQRHVGVV